MLEKIFEKILTVIVEPVQLVLFGWIAYCIREKWALTKINSKLLKAQEERGVVLTKIVTMVEALFQDSRRLK